MPRSARALLRIATSAARPRGARNSKSTRASTPKRSLSRGLAGLFGIVLLTVGCEKPDAPHHFATLLDASTQLGPEWVALSSSDSLRADRHNNCLVITLDTGYQWTSHETELVDPASRDTVRFEADLALADGRRYALKRQGVLFEYDKDPRVTVCDDGPRPGRPRWFRNAFIRAVRPVAVRRIEWQSYDASL